MWGQALRARLTRGTARIIPTRVGTRIDKVSKHIHHGDHPHACGDKLASAFNMDKVEGSSPRVWGQAVSIFVGGLLERIIPTRVGTSLPVKSIAVCSKDHPHACGDKLIKFQQKYTMTGSSPRVWGQVRSEYFRSMTSRIIPTRVGTRAKVRDKNEGNRDHPHACGDKFCSVIASAAILGSSPRVWGQD